MLAAVVTMQQAQQANDSCTLAVLPCTEISLQSGAPGSSPGDLNRSTQHFILEGKDQL